MKVVRIYRDGYRYGILAKSGTKFDHVVVMACPIDSVKVPADDDSQYQYTDYPVDKAVKGFKKAAKTLGITKRAKLLLREGAR